MTKRADEIAADMFERFGVSFVSRNQIRAYLGCSHASADRIASALHPVSSCERYKKYFYKDVAALIAGEDK